MSREADPRTAGIGDGRGRQPGVIEHDGLGLADQLFAALDGQIVTAQSHSWELRIFGIYLRNDRSWLQFRLSGTEQIDGVAALDGWEPDQVLERIRSGLDRRLSSSPTLVC